MTTLEPIANFLNQDLFSYLKGTQYFTDQAWTQYISLTGCFSYSREFWQERKARAEKAIPLLDEKSSPLLLASAKAIQQIAKNHLQTFCSDEENLNDQQAYSIFLKKFEELNQNTLELNQKYSKLKQEKNEFLQQYKAIQEIAENHLQTFCSDEENLNDQQAYSIFLKNFKELNQNRLELKQKINKLLKQENKYSSSYIIWTSKVDSASKVYSRISLISITSLLISGISLIIFAASITKLMLITTIVSNSAFLLFLGISLAKLVYFIKKQSLENEELNSCRSILNQKNQELDTLKNQLEEQKNVLHSFEQSFKVSDHQILENEESIFCQSSLYQKKQELDTLKKERYSLKNQLEEQKNVLHSFKQSFGVNDHRILANALNPFVDGLNITNCCLAIAQFNKKVSFNSPGPSFINLLRKTKIPDSVHYFLEIIGSELFSLTKEKELPPPLLYNFNWIECGQEGTFYQSKWNPLHVDIEKLDGWDGFSPYALLQNYVVLDSVLNTTDSEPTTPNKTRGLEDTSISFNVSHSPSPVQPVLNPLAENPSSVKRSSIGFRTPRTKVQPLSSTGTPWKTPSDTPLLSIDQIKERFQLLRDLQTPNQIPDSTPTGQSAFQTPSTSFKPQTESAYSIKQNLNSQFNQIQSGQTPQQQKNNMNPFESRDLVPRTPLHQ